MSLVAIVLADQRAPGSATGDDQPLLRSPFRGKPLVSWAVDAAASAELDETIVVTGATDLSTVLPARITEVHNNRWAEGRATSLHAGLAAATWEGHTAAVVGWATQPLVPAAAWISVSATAAPVAVATYQGRRSWPVLLHAEVWPLLNHGGDDPVALLAQERPDLVAEVPCPGDPQVFASADELAAWG
jgi:CTP:molybdopterin cytidylyltransferase MocA